MDTLTARVDITTKLAGQEKVPPLVEAELSGQSYTAVEFDLWKNVVHIAVSDEARRARTGSVLEVWEREIERIYRLKGTPTIQGSGYRHIDEEKRYPE